MTKSFPLSALLTCCIGLAGQVWAGDMYYLTFRGTAYQANGSGRIVSSPMTDQTLVAAAAKSSGIDASKLALVYNVNGSSFGDTIDVVRISDGSTVVSYFGLFFGSDASLGRAELNGTNQSKAVDYVYTLNDTAFTTPNSHSMGAVTVTKRTSTDKTGASHTNIQGQNMQWIALMDQGTRIYTGSFQSKKAFTASQAAQ